jgi:hypothetical protein
MSQLQDASRAINSGALGALLNRFMMRRMQNQTKLHMQLQLLIPLQKLLSWFLPASQGIGHPYILRCSV